MMFGIVVDPLCIVKLMAQSFCYDGFQSYKYVSTAKIVIM